MISIYRFFDPLIQRGLVLALGSIEPTEATAGALRVVTQAATRAVASSLVAIPIQRVGA